MGRYEEEYCNNHDIDYFFQKDGELCHVASNGSLIPEWIDRQSNFDIQKKIYKVLLQKHYSKKTLRHFEDNNVNSDNIRRILYNEGYDADEIEEKDVRNYAKTFMDFAMLGIKSYDTINGRLVLISSPNGIPPGQNDISGLNVPNVPEDYELKEGFNDTYLEIRNNYPEIQANNND